LLQLRCAHLQKYQFNTYQSKGTVVMHSRKNMYLLQILLVAITIKMA